MCGLFVISIIVIHYSQLISVILFTFRLLYIQSYLPLKFLLQPQLIYISHIFNLIISKHSSIHVFVSADPYPTWRGSALGDEYEDIDDIYVNDDKYDYDVDVDDDDLVKQYNFTTLVHIHQ